MVSVVPVVRDILFPGNQGIYLENGIGLPLLFYKLGKSFLQVSQERRSRKIDQNLNFMARVEKSISFIFCS